MKYFPTHTGRILTDFTDIYYSETFTVLVGGGGGVPVGCFLTDGKVKCKRSVVGQDSVGVRG